MIPHIEIYPGGLDIDFEDHGLTFLNLDDGIAMLTYFRVGDGWILL